MIKGRVGGDRREIRGRSEGDYRYIRGRVEGDQREIRGRSEGVEGGQRENRRLVRDYMENRRV